jgi:hypothetical protein
MTIHRSISKGHVHVHRAISECFKVKFLLFAFIINILYRVHIFILKLRVIRRCFRVNLLQKLDQIGQSQSFYDNVTFSKAGNIFQLKGTNTFVCCGNGDQVNFIELYCSILQFLCLIIYYIDKV